jgi:hypothetical protein
MSGFLNAGPAIILGQSAVAVSHTGDTAAFTLATVTVLANSMGKNGRLAIKANFSITGVAGVRTAEVQFNGNWIGGSNADATATTSVLVDAEVANRNNAAAQRYGSQNGRPGVSAFALVGALAVDTTVDRTVTFVGQLGNAADTVTLESYQVLLFPKA